jgi:hypothetical protein
LADLAGGAAFAITSSLILSLLDWGTIYFETSSFFALYGRPSMIFWA